MPRFSIIEYRRGRHCRQVSGSAHPFFRLIKADSNKVSAKYGAILIILPMLSMWQRMRDAPNRLSIIF